MYVNPNDPEHTLIKSKIKEWMIKVKLINSDADLDVTELKCADVHCPCITTLVTINGDERFKFQIAKPLVFIREWDIKGLLIQQ